jgi:NAD+ synthetase
MKVGIAQINTTVGDFEGNLKKCVSAIEHAQTHGCDIVLFPEMTLSGYPPLDLLERRAFVECAMRALDHLVKKSKGKGIAVIVGAPEPNPDADGKRVFNSAFLIHDGTVKGVHRKVLLPTYDVFDEARYFEPGQEPKVFEVGQTRIALTICEDIWNDKAVWDRRPYHFDPVGAIVKQNPHIILNLSASPFWVGKFLKRLEVAKNVANRANCPVVYCNLVGGNDGLIFDGKSFVVAEDGSVLGVAKAFEEDMLILDCSTATASSAPEMCAADHKINDVIDALTLGIRDFCYKLSFKKVVVGVSGGVDSAVVTALAVRALGQDSVIPVFMPSRYTSKESEEDAKELAQNLGLRLVRVSIEPMVTAFAETLEKATGAPIEGVVLENLQARIRGVILMAISNREGALVLNTGNKSEFAMGYATLYGDLIGGLSVLGDLTKDMVYKVARALNAKKPTIPEHTLIRPPSAELRPNQKDEDTLPPYPILDEFVRLYVVQCLDANALVAQGFDKEIIKKALSMLRQSEFKRKQAPPILKVTEKAFGAGRMYPIVNKFQDPVE